MTKIDVLDKGYVRYVNHMGDELELVNDLRASFLKESAVFGPADARILKFAFDRKEFSAWRHHVVKVEVKAPMMVRNQLYKYSVGSAQREDQFGWNEASRRYVTSEPEFYIPEEWREAPENKKQGSGAPINDDDSAYFSDELGVYVSAGLSYYDHALEKGVCAEQARLFLPAYALYTTWRWTMSFNALCLVLFERLPHDAQKETADYARALRDLVRPLFPLTIEVLEAGL